MFYDPPAEEAYDEDRLALHHLILKLPVTGLRGLCPALFLEALTGQVHLHKGALSWTSSELMMRRGRGVVTSLKVLGRLHDFERVAWQGHPVLTEDRRAFIWCYLDARYHGTDATPHLAPLNWRPVSFATVRREFRVIAKYHDYRRLSGAWAEEGFESDDEFSRLSERLYNGCHDRKRSLLAHLANSRARWDRLFGGGYAMPDLRVREPERTSTTFSLNRTIDLSEAKLIIKHEKNPFYRALWILAAFGGPRISEMLHLWQCDVLPASTGRHVGGRDQDTLFVLIADPAESTYTGDFTRAGPTRLQHLAQRYGLQPRNHLQGYRRLGWKNPLMTDSVLNFSEVFWCDNDMAAAFAECMVEIRNFHSRNQTSRNHPYLFVNMREGEGFGEPIAYNKAREALIRACRRVGLEPSVNGRRIHGLRHIYKAQLTRLKMDRRHIQVAMRHKSADSQDDYGRTAEEARAALAQRLNWETVK